MPAQRTLRILGIRGIPAAHGGFETFAEHLALYLTRHGWRVVVYCQHEGPAREPWEDTWHGVERVHITVPDDGPKYTMLFDWRSIVHAANAGDLCLTLGYNTALFCAWLRLKGIKNVINMDGIEWSRAKWSGPAKAWFWLNDWAGCWLGNHLVADHPEIHRHLATRVANKKITTIAYGAERVSQAPDDAVRALGLDPGNYLTLIARPEPENSVLEVVRGFSARPRGMKLAVLGKYSDSHPFHRAVRAAASDEVVFVGAIYDKPVVQALRFHSAAYVHGHQVGGTNPSLVEALAAGNAVIAHDNRFNRWVADEAAIYFNGAEGFDLALTQLLADSHRWQALRAAAVRRFEGGLQWDTILGQYEQLLEGFLPTAQAVPSRSSPRG